MANTRQKTKRVGKPFPKQRPAKAPPAPTVEQIKGQIIKLANHVEELMTTRPRPSFMMSNPYDFPKLSEAMRQSRGLWTGLTRLLNGDPEKVQAWIDEALTDQPGAIPRWSRGGRFLLWFDYLPMLVSWGGLLEPDITVTAVDPEQPFVRSQQHAHNRSKGEMAKHRDLPSAGYLGIGAYHRVQPKWNSVLDMTQAYLAEMSKDLLLRPLTEDAKQNVRDTLATEAWIGEALKRGREHWMPMPQHLAAVQQTLFA